MSSPEERRALFRVVYGEPDDAELAALTVVLAAVAAGRQTARRAPGPASTWADRASLLRGPALGGLPAAGRDTWRTSGWPR